MITFTWPVDYGVASDETPTVTTVKFGDGYEQRTTSGINSQPDNWNVTFNNRDAADAAAILTFLKARGGVEAFLWTPPNGVPASYVARRWSQSLVKGNRTSISTTFERVFEP